MPSPQRAQRLQLQFLLALRTGAEIKKTNVVTGRKGSVRFSTFDFTPVELVTARGVERFEIAPPEHIQGPLIETIVRELRGEGVCPSTGVSAARTSRVMDEIMKE